VHALCFEPYFPKDDEAYESRCKPPICLDSNRYIVFDSGTLPTPWRSESSAGFGGELDWDLEGDSTNKLKFTDEQEDEQRELDRLTNALSPAKR
jgi:hypothetical protein